MKFGKTKYIIRTHNLLKTSCDGCITVDDENTYNRMNLAMFNFYKALLIPSQNPFTMILILRYWMKQKLLCHVDAFIQVIAWITSSIKCLNNPFKQQKLTYQKHSQVCF